MDRASWHTTKSLIIPKNIILWFLPPYSPELNPAELIWRELRAKYFNNKTFKSLDEVDDRLVYAINHFASDLDKMKQLAKVTYL